MYTIYIAMHLHIGRVHPIGGIGPTEASGTISIYINLSLSIYTYIYI